MKILLTLLLLLNYCFGQSTTTTRPTYWGPCCENAFPNSTVTYRDTAFLVSNTFPVGAITYDDPTPIGWEAPQAVYDTVKHIIQVSDTASYSYTVTRGFTTPGGDTMFSRNTSVYWVYGYSVREKKYLGKIPYWQHLYYIDANKKRFPRNIVIWEAKATK